MRVKSNQTVQNKVKYTNTQIQYIHRIAIADITDLDVHGPIRADEQVTGSSLHHRIHHLVNLPPPTNFSGEETEFVGESEA